MMPSILIAISLLGAEQKKEDKPYVWPPVAITVLGFEGCQPCAMMQPAIKRLQKSKFPIKYWDIRKQPHLPKAYRSRTYPHVALLIDGRVTMQHVGYMSEAQLVRMFRQGQAIRKAIKEKGR
jgi:thioredoxin-like negative regulator of GroEL